MEIVRKNASVSVRDHRATKAFAGALLVFAVLLVMLSVVTSQVYAADSSVVIDDAQSSSVVASTIQGALDGAPSGGKVIITGTKANEAATITLNIPADKTLVWKAVARNLSFAVSGGGTFEVASGGIIDVVDDTAIMVSTGNVIVSGGSVSVWGDYSAAIQVKAGNVVVSDGSVTAEMDIGHGIYAIMVGEVFTSNRGTVTITGGTVSASSEIFGDAWAVSLQNGGLAAYYAGTCVGGFEAYGAGIIVEVDSIEIPQAYNGTTNGLTRKSGSAITNVKWDLSGSTPVISFMSGSHTITWEAPVAEPELPTQKPVRLQETDELFESVTAAVAAAKDQSLASYTLEVLGNTTELAPIDITADVRIVGSESAPTILFTSTSTGAFNVKDGGALTLGEPDTGIPLTIINAWDSVSVTNGDIEIYDGITMRGSRNTISLSGANASGAIYGGRIEGGSTAVSVENKATLREISGGYFSARIDTVHVSDKGTRIELISGGEFYQTDVTTTLHGHNVFVQNEAQIGEISGGYYQAARLDNVVVIRGAWIGEISGGEFVATRLGSSADKDQTANVWCQTDGFGKTGIGTISGGHYSGAWFGVLIIQNGTRIDSITGGFFEGRVAIQSDYGSSIGEISGGRMEGNQGMLNVGVIGNITGDATFIGKTSYGVYNYSGGTISTISGGHIESTTDHGIANSGTITHISGGKIIGARNAIMCDGMNKGRITTISNGVFWGKNDVAIALAYPVNLEPGITSLEGYGRYWGRNGVIFNNEDLVNYHTHEVHKIKYRMSTATYPVDTITATQFKYLELPLPKNPVVVIDSYAAVTGAGSYHQYSTVTIDAGTREGYTFAGWVTEDGVTFADADSSKTTFEMPHHKVTVTATWTRNPILSTVTVIDSYAEVTGAGTYLEEVLVTIDAGTRPGHTFAGWTTDSGVELDDPLNAQTTFVMPDHDVVVTATWSRDPIIANVVVIDSYASITGAGSYEESQTVTIDAGERPRYTFIGWTTESGIVLSDQLSAEATFTMPSYDVEITANWVHNPHTVTVFESFAAVTGAGIYMDGDNVTVVAGQHEYLHFDGWISEGVELDEPNAATTTFEMPDNNVTVIATWSRGEVDGSDPVDPVDPIDPLDPSDPRPPVEGPKDPAGERPDEGGKIPPIGGPVTPVNPVGGPKGSGLPQTGDSRLEASVVFAILFAIVAIISSLVSGARRRIYLQDEETTFGPRHDIRMR